MTTRRIFLRMLGAGPVGFVLFRTPNPFGPSPRSHRPAFPVGSRAYTTDGRQYRYLRVRAAVSAGQGVIFHAYGACRATAEMAPASCGWFQVL